MEFGVIFPKRTELLPLKDYKGHLVKKLSFKGLFEIKDSRTYTAGYNAHTNVSRVVDGAEPMEFKALFKAWRDKYENTGIGKKYSGQYDHS